MLYGQDWFRQVSQELFEQPGDAIHVVEEVLRVSEVQVARGGIWRDNVSRARASPKSQGPR